MEIDSEHVLMVVAAIRNAPRGFCERAWKLVAWAVLAQCDSLHLSAKRPCCSACSPPMDGVLQLRLLPHEGHVSLAFDPGQEGFILVHTLTVETVAVPVPRSFRWHFPSTGYGFLVRVSDPKVSLCGLRASFACRRTRHRREGVVVGFLENVATLSCG